MNHVYSVSVHDIVDFVMMKGDIDNRYVKKSRMLEGTLIHQLLQKRYTDKDLSEVSVKFELPLEDITLIIQGRIDGVLSYEDDPVIEEIKSTYTALDSPYDSHFAQAKMYAYIYMNQHNLELIGTRVTYYHVADKKTKSFDFEHTLAELTDFFADLCGSYYVYLSMKQKLAAERDRSVAALDFPFKYRKYQKEITARIYKTIAENKNIFINAPTGTGKTINGIYPSLKILPQLNNGKIFYLSAKSTQKQIAEDTLRLLQSNGLKIKAVTITAKEKSCFLDTPSCNPEDCPYAAGYYDKLPKMLSSLLESNDLITAEVLRDFAREHTACPFELSLDTASWADMIICDYNYVFDPSAALKRFFDEDAQSGEHVFLIDEAHNLVDRSRDMYSAQLDKKTILTAKSAVKEVKKLSTALKDINAEMISYQKQCDSAEPLMIGDLSEKLIGNFYKFQSAADDFLSKNSSQRGETYQLIYDLYFELNQFISIYEIRDRAHYIYYDPEEKLLRIFCSDAQAYLRQILKKGKSAVFYSATLTPLPYYCELLGGEKDDRLLDVPAIFDKDKFTIIIDQSVSTRYTARERYYGPIARRIRCVIKNRKGNYLVFFPSYVFMEAVYAHYASEFSATDILMQQRSMSEADRELFLTKFEENGSVCAFAVAGGVFSEGIDLVGGRLTGTVICGVSLPKVGTERELIRAHFDSEGKNGFEYAYLYPGMNKVLQSMGRVIRTKDDVGCAVLLDERFAYSSYKKCFPPHYDQIAVVSSQEELIEALNSAN